MQLFSTNCMAIEGERRLGETEKEIWANKRTYKVVQNVKRIANEQTWPNAVLCAKLLPKGMSNCTMRSLWTGSFCVER